jgi:hypothetical protein
LPASFAWSSGSSWVVSPSPQGAGIQHIDLNSALPEQQHTSTIFLRAPAGLDEAVQVCQQDGSCEPGGNNDLPSIISHRKMAHDRMKDKYFLGKNGTAP